MSENKTEREIIHKITVPVGTDPELIDEVQRRLNSCLDDLPDDAVIEAWELNDE